MKKIQLKHILIVDDSPDQQFLLKTLLEAKGYTTECTSNGKDALVLLHASKNIPEIILLDLNMPVMGGFAFRSLQRVDPILKDIPVVIMSAEEDVLETHNKTQADVLKKPVNISSLLATIERNLH